MKAERCPVCNGSGKYNGEKCHGCWGRGWVTVPEDHRPYYEGIPKKNPHVKRGYNTITSVHW